MDKQTIGYSDDTLPMEDYWDEAYSPEGTREEEEYCAWAEYRAEAERCGDYCYAQDDDEEEEEDDEEDDLYYLY